MNQILVCIQSLCLVIFAMLIMQYGLQFCQRNMNMCNILIYEVGVKMTSGAQKRKEKAQQQFQSSAAKSREPTEFLLLPSHQPTPI